ncbi:MAG: hypothetical protein IIC11_10740 [Proteobacteria bacterium]|nr:hypothetical protein [Pseudomonadota bacterium]
MTNLFEGRGIAARDKIVNNNSGAIFINDKGEAIELYDILYFPEIGRFENDKKDEVENPMRGRDKTIAAIAEWLDSSNIKPENFKMVNNPMMAAALSIWRDQKGELLAYGRYTTQIRAGALGINWTNTQFARETGYSSDDISTKSENIALKASDLFTSEPMTVPEILTIINNLPDTLPEDIREIIPALLNAVARGEETYVPDAFQHRAVIEKYVGEYAAAIAIITGNFVSGNYDDVQTEVLAPQDVDWSDMTLAQFPTSTTQALVDSYVLSEDRSARIAISSKARRGGASASLTSVARILDDKADKFDSNFLAKNEELIHGINLLAKNSTNEGVYKTGKLYNFVSDNDIKIIEYLMNSFDKDEKILTTNLKKLAKSYPNKQFLPKTLMHPNYNLGYRLIAALARKVSKYLNNLGPTELFRAILAQSSMIQVYASTRKRGDSLAFVDFKVVFPATFTGTIIFDAQTNFFSTDKPKGRISFKLKG